MSPPSKPLLVFDGDCGFCRYWIARWRVVTGDRVEYAPYQEAASRFPEIPVDKFQEAVRLMDADGKSYGGAAAVFRTLAYAPGKAWPLWLYLHAPGVAPATEAAYRFIAHRRPLFSKLTVWVYGRSPEPPASVIVRWTFIRLIAAIFLAAFVSLWAQVDGLFGSQGVLPVQELLEALSHRMGPSRYWYVPSLCWLHPGDRILHWLCAAGTAASAGAMLGFLPGPLLLACWAFYLSLVAVGRDFLSFQWDILLLEAGFLAAFLAPWRLLDRPSAQSRPSPTILWLLRWLLARLMFESGSVKLLSQDPSWRHLAALTVHYETQPLPTWIGWYAHHLPLWWQKTSCAAMFAIELALPFFVFAPRRFRQVAFGGFLLLQCIIIATGNYCFFNFLAIALSLLLLDDTALAAALPKRALQFFRVREKAAPGRRVRSALTALLACVYLGVSGAGLASVFGVRIGKLSDAYAALEPLRTINNYGLFAIMTTVRNEIVLEGSDDGKEWKPYEFKWKPGDVHRRPAFVAPHQPRLDWQMWFAALSGYRDNPWLFALMARLLQGSRPVLALLKTDPFPNAPPRYIRAVVYRYHFTDAAERRADGAWWKRELLGLYAPVVSLRAGKAP